MLWEQARHLAARGHDVRVVSRADADATAPVSVAHERVRIQQFLADRGSIARFIRSSIFGARRAVSEVLANQPADVLHVHQPLAGYGALASRAGARLPSLYSFYSPAPLEYRSRQGMTARHRTGLAGATGTALLWAIERACLKRARLVHVLSDFSADQLRKLYAVPRERIVRIRGAAATERFKPAPDRGAVRCALGLSADRPLLLTVRNLEARMGLDTLLDAMARLKARCPRVVLLIGGAGSLRGTLEAQSQALGLADHVKFLGFVPDAELPRYYQAADLFVLPTRELEGFGLVTVEALACGTPVLGTPVGATPEILRALCPRWPRISSDFSRPRRATRTRTHACVTRAASTWSVTTPGSARPGSSRAPSGKWPRPDARWSSPARPFDSPAPIRVLAVPRAAARPVRAGSSIAACAIDGARAVGARCRWSCRPPPSSSTRTRRSIHSSSRPTR